MPDPTCQQNDPCSTANDVDDLADLLKDLQPWEGPAVFLASETRHVFASANAAAPCTPERPSGRSSSPISVSSGDASPSPAALLRPRAVPQYTSPAARTAYTPTRSKTYPTAAAGGRLTTRPSSSPTGFTQRNVFQAKDKNIDDAGPSRPLVQADKAMHPFFNRGFRARPIVRPAVSSSPVPVARQPRYVAHYSSTSASEAVTDSQGTASTFGSQPGPSSSQGSVKGKGKPVDDVDELVEEVANLRVVSTQPAAAAAAAASVTAVNTDDTPIRRRDFTHLPNFSYRTYTKTPPRVAYTTSMAEAEDLLGCLRGNVMGFDLEWPASGLMKTVDANGKVHRVMVGGAWNPKKGKYEFHQARTALAQICDENLVVLIHLRNPKDRLPNKLVEILKDKDIYKLGVAISNDGSKLVRDFPRQFTDGISSLLELSRLARSADPIGTGPGNTLIALATLVGEYLGHRLPKEQAVRGSDWSKALSQDQIDYAVNDVWCSLHLYKQLMARAAEAGITPDLDACSSPAGNVQVSVKAGGSATKVSAPKATLAQRQALQRLLAGEEISEIASSKGIMLQTVQQYVCRAAEASEANSLSLTDKARIVKSIAPGSFAATAFSKTLTAYKREVQAAQNVAMP